MAGRLAHQLLPCLFSAAVAIRHNRQGCNTVTIQFNIQITEALVMKSYGISANEGGKGTEVFSSC